MSPPGGQGSCSWRRRGRCRASTGQTSISPLFGSMRGESPVQEPLVSGDKRSGPGVPLFCSNRGIWGVCLQNQQDGASDPRMSSQQCLPPSRKVFSPVGNKVGWAVGCLWLGRPFSRTPPPRVLNGVPASLVAGPSPRTPHLPEGQLSQNPNQGSGARPLLGHLYWCHSPISQCSGSTRTVIPASSRFLS